jgi:sigma-54 dependent transcriptional regulator
MGAPPNPALAQTAPFRTASPRDLERRDRPIAEEIRARALVVEDARSREILGDVRRIAPTDATVLIVGETGTGKELVARHLHDRSARARGPFVAVNCGALSESLVNSELFGHEKGAFTGATSSKVGWFEAAAGGTLFLDEVGDLSLAVQAKLLRVLQEREVVRVGSVHARSIDVRLVAATNIDLHAEMSARRFREDLYFRLSVMVLSMPALRERPGDVLPLAEHFLRVHNLGTVPSLTAAAVRRLEEHSWPGNVRELENVMRRAAVTCQNGRVDDHDLKFHGSVPAASPQASPAWPGEALDRVLGEVFRSGSPDSYRRIESAVVLAAYAYCRENQVETAHMLGITRNVLRTRLARLGVIAGRRDRPRSELPPTARPPRREVIRALGSVFKIGA